MNQAPRLPAELISNILEYSTVATLANAALCSQQWYEIAIPHLYRRIDVTGYPQLKSLTALLLRKPVLAGRVRHLSFRIGFVDSFVERYTNYYGMDDYDTDRDGDLSEEADEANYSDEYELELASNCSEELWKALNFVGPDEEPATLLEKADSVDSFLALLLPCLMNVESLDLEVPGFPIYMERDLWRTAREGKVWRNLKSMLWTYDGRNDPIACTSCGETNEPPTEEEMEEMNEFGTPPGYLCAGIFALPAIEAIYLHRIGSLNRDLNYGKLPLLEHGSSKCNHLELRGCDFNPTDMRNLIKIPKALRSFILEVRNFNDHLSFPAILDGLEKHKDSLEDLRLDFSYSTTYWFAPYETEGGPTPPMASLRAFTQVRRIKVALQFIIGYGGLRREYPADRYPLILEFLPPGIETISLTQSEQPEHEAILLTALEQLLIRKDAYVPKLRIITAEVNGNLTRRIQLAEILRLADDLGLKMMFLDVGERKLKFNSMVERKWGFDEDVERRPCGNGFDRRPVLRTADLQY